MTNPEKALTLRVALREKLRVRLTYRSGWREIVTPARLNELETHLYIWGAFTPIALDSLESVKLLYLIGGGAPLK